MKIAILVYSTTVETGTSLVARQQAALLTKTGCDVTLFTFPPISEPVGMSVKTLRHPLGFLPWRSQVLLSFVLLLLPPPLHLPLIYQCIRQLSKFDAVVAYDYPLSWLAYYAKKLYGLKYVWFVQGIPLPETCGRTREKVYCRLQQSSGLYRLSAANADIVAVEANFLKETLKHRFGIESIVIRNLTHLSFNLSVTGDEIRHRYHLGNEPLILYVDNLQAYKGIEILLDSFALVRETIPHAKLLIIGKWHNKSYWHKIQRRFDSSIIYVNYVPHDEIAAFYAASTIFATCTVWEAGFSHTIVEAQALGKPVVAFNVGAHQEVVRHGETGILVDQVGDTQQFASALVKLLNDEYLAGSMGGNAVKWAERLANQGVTDFGEMLNSIKG